jgi:hypothetical protein
MKNYEKTIDGRVVRLSAKNIVITKDGMTTTNPTHEQIIADGWVEYIAPPKPEPTAEELLALAKRDKKRNITYYDKSVAVNSFYIGDTQMWLDKETRTGLKLRFEAEIAMGKTDTTLWADGVQYPLSLETAIQMLYALEIYASACYDNTQAHLAAIDTMTTVEEVEAYDHTSGYPEKLRF